MQYELLAMTSTRLKLPEMDSTYDIRPDDETLFTPFMDLVLEPGEYGSVLGLNDTADSGYGHVYTKRADGAVTKVGSLSGAEGQQGADTAAECAARYEFRPETGGEGTIRAATVRRGDPILKYRNVRPVEYALAGDEPLRTADIQSCPECPECGTTDDVEGEISMTEMDYDQRYFCQSCVVSFTVYYLNRLQSPTDDCQECGGTFLERDLQYPEIGSTAFECDGCGFVTFDTLELPEADMAPEVEREDLVGPDVAAYRMKHGLDLDGADSDGSGEAEDGDAESGVGVLDSIRRLLGL